MSKKKIVVFVIVMLMIALTLTGCAGKSIDFKIEQVNVQLNSEYNTNLSFQMVNKISNFEELKQFFNNSYFGENTVSKLTMFDNDYFSKSCLLVVCYPKSKNENMEITDLTLKGTELFVRMERKYANAPNDSYKYVFITIDKDIAEQIEKLSYIIVSK